MTVSVQTLLQTGLPNGYTGSQGVGYTGSLGGTGYTGSLGYTGSQGTTGTIGYTGSAGSIGYTGSASTVAGPTGFTGSQGNIGFTGSQGDIGYTGSASTAVGPTGFTGSQGSVGFTGSAGTTGFTGSAGNDGTNGFTGSHGDIGYTGSASTVAGPTGFTGSQGTAAGLNTHVQYNASGVFGANANFTYDATTSTLNVGNTTANVVVSNAAIWLNGPNSFINLDQNDNTTLPTGNTMNYVALNMAGRMMPAFQASDQDGVIQPHLNKNRIYMWMPVGLNTTTAPAVLPGTTVYTAVGTATARAFATTNILTRTTRVSYVSAATAGSLASLRVPSAFITTGSGTLGGFTMGIRFAVPDAGVVGGRMFVGVSSSTGAATNVEPSTLLNSFGVAQLSTDATQWYFVYGGSAAQTAVALGTGLGAPTLTNTVWDLVLFSPVNQNGVIGYQLTNLSSGVTVRNTITPGTPGTQTPASTTALTVQTWRTNNATASAVAIDFVSQYIETDN